MPRLTRCPWQPKDRVKQNSSYASTTDKKMSKKFAYAVQYIAIKWKPIKWKQSLIWKLF